MTLITPAQFYNDWASRYERSITEMGWSAHAEILKDMSPHVFSGVKIFEIGIGTGALAEKFKAVCDADITGTDVSTAMVRLCLEKGVCSADKLLKINLETEKTPLPDASFDLAVSCGVFEYMENVALVCAEAARLVGNGGYLAFCYEAGADGPETIAVPIRDRNGRDDDGTPIRGLFFSYKHPREVIERHLRENSVTVTSHRTFQSAVVHGEPIFYHLAIGRKDTLCP